MLVMNIGIQHEQRRLEMLFRELTYIHPLRIPTLMELRARKSLLALRR